jgi:hypothetical protein
VYLHKNTDKIKFIVFIIIHDKAYYIYMMFIVIHDTAYFIIVHLLTYYINVNFPFFVRVRKILKPYDRYSITLILIIIIIIIVIVIVVKIKRKKIIWRLYYYYYYYYYYYHHYLFSFMQGIHTHIPETNHVPRECIVAAILSCLWCLYL